MKRRVMGFTMVSAVIAAMATVVAAIMRKRRAAREEEDLQLDLARFEGEGGATAP